MTTIEQIRAEIKRLEGVDYPCDTSEQATGFYDALDRISRFLDTLQEPEVDLEKEIDKTVNECTDGYNFDWDKFALHFYELGKNSK